MCHLDWTVVPWAREPLVFPQVMPLAQEGPAAMAVDYFPLAWTQGPRGKCFGFHQGPRSVYGIAVIFTVVAV